jgi:hypothetical protein
MLRFFAARFRIPEWKRRREMRIAAWLAVLLAGWLLVGCSRQVPAPPAENARPEAPPPVVSVYTGLDAASCESRIDPEDPNQTKFLFCPGAAGYSLIVRRVDSGRHSVEIVEPNQHLIPLNYQEFVTRAMSNVTGKAEWRVRTENGSQKPIALTVRLQAREDLEEPETVTNTYVAIAKITPAETCVTDVFAADAKPESEWRVLADSANQRPCVKPQPPLSAGRKTAR